MVIKLDKLVMQKELLELYKEFIINPSDKNIKEELVEYDKLWGGLSIYADYFKDKPISSEIQEALEHLSTLYQYGDGLEMYDDKEIIEIAKNVLLKLEESS